MQSEREVELFNQGYEFLFSYKPDSAASAFRSFLKEFPDSSARDAAMFWLAKTLISLKSYDEAEAIFREMADKFPDSPFLSFVESEKAEIIKARSSVRGEPSAQSSPPSDRPVGKAEVVKTPPVADKAGKKDDDFSDSAQPEQKLSVSANKRVMADLEEANTAINKKNSELMQEITRLSGLNEDLKIRFQEMEQHAEQLKKDARILSSSVAQLMFRKKEQQSMPDPALLEERENLKKSLDAEKSRSEALTGRITELTKKLEDAKQAPSESPQSKQQPAKEVLRIKDRGYPLTEVIERSVASGLLQKKLGIKEIIWRSGNPLDDFINEELLLNEAAKSSMTADARKLKELVAANKLDAMETAYLQRFIIIASFIDSQDKNKEVEQWIETLSVEFKPGDANSRTVLSTELQKAAREKRPFEEIERAYGQQGVKFFRFSLREFSSRYREKSQIIQKLNFMNEDTIVIWTEKGYMLIKPVTKSTPFNPFEDMPEKKKVQFTALVKKLIADLRQQSASQIVPFLNSSAR